MHRLLKTVDTTRNTGMHLTMFCQRIHLELVGFTTMFLALVQFQATEQLLTTLNAKSVSKHAQFESRFTASCVFPILRELTPTAASSSCIKKTLFTVY